jgi:hypothetical protein
MQRKQDLPGNSNLITGSHPNVSAASNTDIKLFVQWLKQHVPYPLHIGLYNCAKPCSGTGTPGHPVTAKANDYQVLFLYNFQFLLENKMRHH